MGLQFLTFERSLSFGIGFRYHKCSFDDENNHSNIVIIMKYENNNIGSYKFI